MQSLYASFRAAWRPDAAFLVTPGGPCWTYTDLEKVTADLGRRLRGAGLQPGDRLVALLERSAWNVFLYLACARAGIIYVPLNPRLTGAELSPIIADADPAMIVCDPALERALREVVANTSVPIRTMDVIGKGSLDNLQPAEGAVDVPLVSGHPAAIIFTSGTTGKPKGALVPHELFVGKAQALGSALGYTPDDRLVHTLPLYHAHGLFMTLHCVLNAGASMLLLPKFDARQVVQCLPEASVFSGVPTMYKRLLEEPGLAQGSAGMRLFISGSAPLPSNVFTTFEQRSGHRIVECWGMSETMTNTASPLHGERRPGSAGKALPGVVLLVVDPTGQPVAPGTPGTLKVGFPKKFGGYWRRPPSEQPVFSDGCMVTGDIGFVDSDGYLTLVGRTHEVIISGGYNVYPREVEVALEELAEVDKAAVFGVPHPDLGEAVVAAVQTTAGSRIDPQEILRKLRLRLIGYKLPKSLFLEAALPLTELGKIQRGPLKEKYAGHFQSGHPRPPPERF